MGCNFYAGHDFEWMEKFMKAIPKEQQLVRSTAFAIACCIHHQYIYKKQKNFKLSHKTLALFGINRKSVKLYLLQFQQAKLIKYCIEKGKSPAITLLLIPSNTINKT